ncbi:MAG: cytochrome c3 family protein [Candidatus Riflebacteria bacterium]|nr:cytochrome c3 family protein [Candidatus Riflebacteria bacterium]
MTVPDLGRVFERAFALSRDRLLRIVVVAGIAAVGCTVVTVGWVTQPSHLATGYAPRQPIPFSHKLHAGTLSIPCVYCHSGTTRSRHAGVPAVETCMNCHRVTRTDRPAIQQLTRIHESGATVAWERVHALPAHVFFDHRPHVTAGIACQTCHGDVQGMTVLKQHMSLRMGACLGCHRNPADALPRGSSIVRGPEHCQACHR